MTANASVKQLDIVDIIRDQETLQVRTEVDPKTVEQYARSMRAGSKFPPVQVYEVDGRLFLVDGFHRVAAAEAVADHKKALTRTIAASVTVGTMGEAMQAAALANTTNGKALKTAEYRRSFRMLAKSGVLEGLDSRTIADMMNNVVSHVTIWKWANEDFPGLLGNKAKKGERPEGGGSRPIDPLSAAQVEQQAAISALYQSLRLLNAGKVTSTQALNEIAQAATEVLAEAVKRGGDPEGNPSPF
ncbi:ParB N-terminal domain-containing protein [Magnetospirillum fulvum]|uniref:ParB-like N-terminal domain-containing protein n=1 Tax=Magnetospirillum fulvum MGU-K5 TaxID=1316936 RepID=S9TSX5_MAGFU|nr:ParB N-terminal domain-containing protein [Magnetospirillum fulvum]EPY01620.1 hypothetical protein K678_09908 [Magnetospirillum fulvum MGU-K5]